METFEIFLLTLSKRFVCILQEITGSNTRKISKREQRLTNSTEC